MFDLLIRDGLVYDGSGQKPEQADVGILADRIVEIGNLTDAKAVQVIEAAGKAVLPGMIDVHTHTDAQFISVPERVEALLQGVTTEITGACGIGLFPLTDEQAVQYLPTIRSIVGEQPHAYESCDAYLRALPATGTNVAVQVPHSPLRMAIAGCEDRPLTQDEMKRFCALARAAFEEGACGVSTGLAYYPASFGDTHEVVELCKAANEFDAPMSVHQRTAFRKLIPGFNSREEVLDFARQSGARLQYSHYRTTPGTAGQTDALLEPINRGLSEGLRITADFYPYPVGAGYAAVILPMWVMEGGFASTMEKLRKPENRTRILKEVREGNPLLSNGVVTHMPRHPEYIGMCYRDMARRRGQDIAEMLLDLLVEEELDIGYRLEADFEPALLEKQEKDFITFLSQPYYMLGSDTLPGQMHPHPRSCGAFAKMLRLCIKHRLPLEMLANRASALAAQTFGLKDRGTLAKKSFADVCVFDPARVSEKSSFEDPTQYAVGMDAVVVNGKLAVENGKPTGVLSGRPLRRGL